MFQKDYAVYTTEECPFEQMCQSLLSQIDRKLNVIKIVFFGPSQNNKEYLDQLQLIKKCVRGHFPLMVPVISYVSQKPLKGMLNAEVTLLSTVGNTRILHHDNYIILENGSYRELITGGILPPDITATHAVQSNAVFARLKKILSLENFPINSIVRQWNYIENISRFNGEFQNYQAFNDSRSHFYAGEDWHAGYPAATGIGTQSGGVMVELIASVGDGLINLALDNPWQVAAYQYSQGVLVGAQDPCFGQRSTPKFERARMVGLPGRLTIYISGTAAIRGESSHVSDDLMAQTKITMENIDYLISPQNLPVGNVSGAFKLLRIYVKNPGQMEQVRTFMKANYPEILKIYICADICRDELLIEIEGVVQTF